MLNTWFFLNTPLELASLLLIVLLAGIVRGAIGFGFSALVVASAGFWLAPVAVICLVILLETAASLLLLAESKDSINKPVLWRITLSGAVSSVFGVMLLASISHHSLSLFITIYLATISILTLTRLQFKTEVSLRHYTIAGLVAGFANGLAGIGGLFIAFFMNATQTSVGQLRATISAYFFFSELIFLVTAYFQGLYTLQIIITALVCLIPLWIGTRLGSVCFNTFSEDQLKRGVLIALLTLSGIGLIKTLFITA